MSYTLFCDPETDEGRSRTKQSFSEDANINNIMARWEATGMPPHDRNGPGVYADFSEAQEFSEAMIAVQNAQEAFMSLPASVRKFFEHDPAKLIAFVSDPANLPEAEKLGLLEKEKAEPGASHIPQGEASSEPKTPSEDG